MDISAEAERDRRAWDAGSDEYQARHSDDLQRRALAWGVYRIPEAELHVLGDVEGKDILEFGCGAAQFSIALAKLGARMTGLDNSSRQLQHARELMTAAGLDFPLVHASAESVPLPHASFDTVFCDHGAMSWADPYKTVPEASRLLRPGGLLAFANSSPLWNICFDPQSDAVGDRLIGDYFDLHRFPEEREGVSSQLPYGEWIRLFRRHGLVVEDLIEMQPPPEAETTYEDYVPLEWARRYPGDHIWKVREA
jgi:SAM-dependent methyltransferase